MLLVSKIIEKRSPSYLSFSSNRQVSLRLFFALWQFPLIVVGIFYISTIFRYLRVLTN